MAEGPEDDRSRPPGSGKPEEQRARHGTDADLVVPFLVYVLLTVSGLTAAIVIGLTHG